VQAVQRLYGWGAEIGLLREHPIRSIKQPNLGQREPSLLVEEEDKLLEDTDCHSICHHGQHVQASIGALNHGPTSTTWLFCVLSEPDRSAPYSPVPDSKAICQ
jgi:hypothetical protein